MTDKQKLLNDLTDEFLPDPRFGKLADRYSVDFEAPSAEPDWTDRKFSAGPAEVQSPLKAEIVKFANSGDEDARRLLAAAGVRDMSAKSAFRTAGWEGTCNWDQAQGRWLFAVTSDEGEHRAFYIDGTADDPDRSKILAAQELAKYNKTGKVRVLGPDDVLLLQRLASFDPIKAFERGLELLFADLPEAQREEFDAYSIISREGLQPVLRELVYIVFLGSSLGNALSAAEAEAFEQFADGYVGPRPFNLNLIQAAFEAWQDDKVVNSLEALDEKQVVTEKDLDELSDEEIDQLYDSVTASYIKSQKWNR